MTPHIIPSYLLGYHPDESTWFGSVRWMDVDTGTSGTLNIAEQPSPKDTLIALEALVLATTWPMLQVPDVYPRPVLHTHPWNNDPPQRRAIQRLAKLRHWDVAFDWIPELMTLE